METTTAERPVRDAETEFRLPAFVDWLVGVALVLGGLVLALGGSAVWLLVDRAMVADAVASGDIQSSLFTGADLVEVALATITWTAIGLLVTGVLMFALGVGFVAMRRRTHRRAAAGEPTSDFFANSLTGAVVSGVLSFVPFSPVVGGAVAGYFERGESERSLGAGAFSGLLGMAPVATVAAFVLAGAILGVLAVGESDVAVFLAIVTLVVVMIVATIGAGLGALGGYVGGRLADNRR